MTTHLSLALLLCALLPLADGFCTAGPQQVTATHCLDETDNEWHPIGSSWRNSACMDCSCSGCCAAFSIPRKFPADCVSVLDPVACKYKVYKRDNPSEECPVFGAVGK
ncbi:small serum protein 2-like [Entelurus aequoreus]|uniref:small serum protein 2-like n=1 Tax=Entelurus aequoreus TaxID=161455 RepID=UPI002B1DB544|nr:small serum protein 2-like [Entelurus aequoreus]